MKSAFLPIPSGAFGKSREGRSILGPPPHTTWRLIRDETGVFQVSDEWMNDEWRVKSGEWSAEGSGSGQAADDLVELF